MVFDFFEKRITPLSEFAVKFPLVTAYFLEDNVRQRKARVYRRQFPLQRTVKGGKLGLVNQFMFHFCPCILQYGTDLDFRSLNG